MSTSPLIEATETDCTERLRDRDVAELVDALVQAVDLNRWADIERRPHRPRTLPGRRLFDAELRLNGVATPDEWCICGGEEL